MTAGKSLKYNSNDSFSSSIAAVGKVAGKSLFNDFFLIFTTVAKALISYSEHAYFPFNTNHNTVLKEDQRCTYT